MDILGTFSTIPLTHLYVYTLNKMYDDKMHDKDILNQTIVSIPTCFGNIDIDVCVWNLSHVVTYYYASKAINEYITKNKIIGAGICFFGGVVWYIYEDAISNSSYMSSNPRIVYPNITKPQPSDFIFNIAGQILFIAGV
jgi:hypothetical protein